MTRIERFKDYSFRDLRRAEMFARESMRVQRKANFKGANISGMLIKDMDFEGCNFDEANLANTHFLDCDMRACTFTRAKCSSSIFDRCRLDKANFTAADLRQAYFEKGQIWKTTFQCAELSKTTFSSTLHINDADFGNSMVHLYIEGHHIFIDKEWVRIDKEWVRIDKGTFNENALFFERYSGGIKALQAVLRG